MAIDYEKLKAWDFGEQVVDWTWEKSALYALGVGLGFDPVDPDQLRYTYEPGMLALPTMAVVVAPSHFWLRDPATGVDWKRVVHGEEGITLHQTLLPQGRYVTRSRVDEIIDKGEGKGALIYMTREVCERRVRGRPSPRSRARPSAAGTAVSAGPLVPSDRCTSFPNASPTIPATCRPCRSRP